MVSCFPITCVPLWKFLVTNITQISGACSLFCQKWAWRCIFSTTETDSPPFLWLMQPTWRKVMKAWSYYWERLSMSKWKLCGDLKVVALLLGMQLGYTKYCCFLCQWDSQDKKNHYVIKMWPKWASLTPGEKNVVSPPLVLPEKIYLPPLHIKLGLMKNYVQGMDEAGRRFDYVRNKFPNVSDAKIKEGIFIGPQIRELMQDKRFDEDLNETERNARL